MAVLYKTIQSTMKTKDGQKLFHPRTVHIATIGTPQLAREVAEYSSLSTGDVKNTIDNMVTVMTKHLQSSEMCAVRPLYGYGRRFGQSFESRWRRRQRGSAGISLLLVHADKTIQTQS